MSRNEKGTYRIQPNPPNNLYEQYIQDMYQLTPKAKPLKYINLHYTLEELDNIIAKDHLYIYKYICEQHPNKKIRTEFRIKSPASILEKSYMKTQTAVKNNTYNENKPPIIYDGVALRIIIDHVEFEIAQSGEVISNTTGQSYNAIRTKDNKILEICIGDYIILGENELIEVTKDNLVHNYDGSLSIETNGNRYSLSNKKIQKTDRATLKQADFEVGSTLTECLIKNGYIFIKERTKDFITHPKYTYRFHNFNKNSYRSKSKRMLQKLRTLQQNKSKINFARNKKIVTSAYESLHYCVYDPEYAYYCEYQVRDAYMHEISENDPYIGHDTYKQLPIDATAKYRVPKAGTFIRFSKDDEARLYDYYFYDEDYMYKKIFKKPKEEVFKDVARLEIQQKIVENVPTTEQQDFEI